MMNVLPPYQQLILARGGQCTAVIPSEVEGPRGLTDRRRRRVSRLRCAPLGMTAFLFRLLLAALLFGWMGSAWGQQTDAWQKANEEYAAGHFREARELYDGLVRSGQGCASLFYNLGNACFRVDDLGHAILNYERALALQPRHPEAATNLRLVRDKARALELRKTAVERAAHRGTAAQYSTAAAVSFWIAAFLLAGWFVGGRRSPGKIAIVGAAILVFGSSLAGLYILENGSTGSALAVITAKKTEARLATADNAQTVLALPPGSEIKILNTRGEWAYAALPNELRGWIPAQSAERVRR